MFQGRLAGILVIGAVAMATQAVAADAKNGAEVFARCAICHSNTKGAPARIGPNLFGVVGRKAGTQPDFSYSAALKNSGIVWTPANLDRWTAGPAAMVPGNRMSFAGISSARDRSDLVAYLGTLK
ncbi:MAG TPA: cytochrome c family protein [Rhizomicrobium sp.]|jgi:cytochrome c|nr:cytochrome c family protein [Rhizomicrobium sp.]